MTYEERALLVSIGTLMVYLGDRLLDDDKLSDADRSAIGRAVGNTRMATCTLSAVIAREHGYNLIGASACSDLR